jgi:hypothetical protein
MSADGTIEPSILGSHNGLAKQPIDRPFALAGWVTFEKRDPPLLRAGLARKVRSGAMASGGDCVLGSATRIPSLHPCGVERQRRSRDSRRQSPINAFVGTRWRSLRYQVGIVRLFYALIRLW